LRSNRPYRLVAQQPGTRLEFEAFDDYYRPVHIKSFTIVSVPEAATQGAGRCVFGLSAGTPGFARSACRSGDRKQCS
jgi:hypothetical protein